MLIKHAPNVPQCALAIKKCFEEAGVGDEVFNVGFLSNDQVAAVIGDPRIHGVSFTGSEQVGRLIGELAGKNLKKVILELGGSDPFIVCEDSDVEQAASYAVQSRFANAGQVYKDE